MTPWKTLFALLALSLAASASAAPAPTRILSCKKQHFWVHSSYTWATIDRLDDGSHEFTYGNGIDTGMLEVFFDSPVTRASDTSYSEKGRDYELTVSVDAKKNLSFTIKDSRGKKITEKGLKCD